MKLIKLLSLTIALFLFWHCGYTQPGNLSGKVKNKSEKPETPAGKTPKAGKPEAATDTTAEMMTNKSNNINTKNMSTENIPVNSKFFGYDDLKIIPGATFYFSNKPFGNSHDEAKTNFNSNESIYGRLELKNQTMQEAFKLSPMGNTYYLIYHFAVVSGGEGKEAQTIHNSIMIKQDDLKKSVFNFDLLPDPAHATTVIGMNYDYGFNATHVSGGPMYQIIDQNKFPDNGDYIIQVQFYFRPVDGWGNGLPNSSDWPGAEGAFHFSFNTSDVAAIQKNSTAVHENVKSSAFKLHSLPDYWPKTSRKLPDAALSPAALEAMIKTALSAEGNVLVKYAVANNSPGSLWTVQKNDLGVPTYQLLEENVYTIYKSEGNCFVGDVSIAKDYLGGGKYGKPYVRSVNVATSGYGTAIDCSAIK